MSCARGGGGGWVGGGCGCVLLSIVKVAASTNPVKEGAPKALSVRPESFGEGQRRRGRANSDDGRRVSDAVQRGMR